MGATGLRQVREENLAFMTCMIRVNVRRSGWQKIVAGVVKNTNGVSTFRMDEDGMVEVSGTVDPKLLLKVLAKAGRRAELCWFQFGQCHSNLYIPDVPDRVNYYDYVGHGYCKNYGYNGCGGFGYKGYGGNNYNGDHMYLNFTGYGHQPRPRISYRQMGAGSVLGPTAPPFPGEGVSCCSLM